MFWRAADRWAREQRRIEIKCEHSREHFQGQSLIAIVLTAAEPVLTIQKVGTDRKVPIDFSGAEIRLASFERIDLADRVQAFRVAWDDDHQNGFSLCTFTELREAAKPN
jgi:hypothetical protein